MRFRRIVEESEDALAWVKKMYGAKTADMLQDYCAEKDKDINKVVWDERPDRSGVTAWDKFEYWAKSKRRTNVQKDRFGDTTIDDYLPSGNSRRGRLGKVYDEPSMSDMVAEERLNERFGDLTKMTDGVDTIYVDDDGIESMKKKGFWAIKSHKPSPFFSETHREEDDFMPSRRPGSRSRPGDIYSDPGLRDMMEEATGKDEYAIADYVGNDLRHCSFVDNFCWGDYADMTFEIDGIKYRLSVERAPGEVNAFDDAI